MIAYRPRMYEPPSVRYDNTGTVWCYADGCYKTALAYCDRCDAAAYCDKTCRVRDRPGHTYVCHKDLADRLRGICRATVMEFSRPGYSLLIYDELQRHTIYIAPRFVTCASNRYWISPFAASESKGLINCACCMQAIPTVDTVNTVNTFTWKANMLDVYAKTNDMYNVAYHMCAECMGARRFICPNSFTSTCTCWHGQSALILELTTYLPRDVLGLIVQMMQKIRCA